jgi:outer membrane protein assembly factor BamB
LGSFGRLNCLDGASGKPIWYRQIIDPVKDKTSFPMWGKSGSPVIVDGRVIVSAGVPPDHSLEAYDAASGDLVWHAGSALSAYDAPALMVLDGVPQLVIVNSVTVDSHDPNTGKLLWSTEWKGTDPKVAQPVAVGDRGVYVGAAYGYGSRLFDVARQGDAWLVTERWHSMKLKPKINNVIVRNGFAYGLDDGRGLVCIELEKGTMKWRSGRFGYGQILAVDELLLVQAESGEVALVEFSPDGAHELTRFEALSSKTWNQPILAGRYLLVRNDQQAACFELPVAE